MRVGLSKAPRHGMQDSAAYGGDSGRRRIARTKKRLMPYAQKETVLYRSGKKRFLAFPYRAGSLSARRQHPRVPGHSFPGSSPARSQPFCASCAAVVSVYPSGNSKRTIDVNSAV